MAEVLGQRLRGVLRTFQMAAPELSENAVKAASAVGVNSLRHTALQQVGAQLVVQRAKYQAALRIVCRGGAPVVQREATIKV